MSSEGKEKCIGVLNNPKIMTPALLLIALILAIYTDLSGNWGDLDNYYVNAGDVLSGLMPYSDMMFEYPPVSMLFMLIPRALSWDLESFHFLSAALTYVFLAIGIYCLYRISDKYIGDRWRVNFLLISLVLFGTYFVIARNDSYAASIAIVGIWLYLEKRYPAAFAVITIAAMTKLYPAIFVLPMIVPFVLKRDWLMIVKSGIVCAVVILIVELPFLIADPGTAFAYLTYHSDRGIQIESVASGFIMVASLLIPTDISTFKNYGSDNLVGTLPDMLAPYMNLIMGLAIIIFVLIMIYRISKSETGKNNVGALVALMCTAVLMLFLTFSKVYSAQYYVWVLLALPFTQLACFGSIHRKEILLTTVIFGMFTFASYTSYPVYGLVDLNPFPVAMVFMKNLLHLLLTVEVLHLCWYESRKDSKMEEHGILLYRAWDANIRRRFGIRNGSY